MGCHKMIQFSIRPAVLSLLLLAPLLCAGGCGEDGQQIEVQLDVHFDHRSLPAGGPVELTYVWQMAADAKPVNFDCLVFAHFRGADGEIHWQDDHHPPIPTSQWQPGQTVRYTRIHFIPDSAPLEKVTLTAGLYDHAGTKEKVLLAGRTRGFEPVRFEVLPASQRPIVIYDKGWYNQESKPGQREGPTWRWCRREAFCWVELPGRPCSLFLEVQAPLQTLETAQPMTLELDGTGLASLELESADPEVHKIPIPQQLLEGKECVRLVVRTDRAAEPQKVENSIEERELGLKFFHLTVY